MLYNHRIITSEERVDFDGPPYCCRITFQKFVADFELHPNVLVASGVYRIRRGNGDESAKEISWGLYGRK